MYWNMSCHKPETLVIHRGMALHKMLRLITLGIGGDVKIFRIIFIKITFHRAI